MLELEKWNSALSSITGTLVRGTGRISTAHCLDLLEVGPDPSTRQKVAKRRWRGRGAGRSRRLGLVEVRAGGVVPAVYRMGVVGHGEPYS